MSISVTQKKTKIQPDPAWAPLLQTAAREVFETTLAAETVPAANMDFPDSSDVVALVGIAGAVCGLVSLHCDAKTAVHMAERKTGKDRQEFNEAARDALSEICKLVATNFRAKMADLSDTCMISVPMVISGANFQLQTMGNGGRVEVPMAFEGGPFWVTLDLHS